MLSTEPRHPRHNFLIERIAFFSDAVFAIAITLIAIEIHPPHIVKGDTEEIAWHKFREKLPEFLGLLVSFWLIGGAWLRHHQLFKYVDNYDAKFMVINLWLLFTIVLFPFSTSFLFNSIFEGGITRLQVYFYLGVPFLSNLILFIMYKRVDRRHLKGAVDQRFRTSMFSQKAMIAAFSLSLSWIILAPVQYHFFGYIFLYLGPLMIFIFKRKLKKNAKPGNTSAD